MQGKQLLFSGLVCACVCVCVCVCVWRGVLRALRGSRLVDHSEA